MRRLVRTALVAGTTGAVALSAAWAGVGLAPVPVPTLPAAPAAAPQLPGTPGLPALSSLAAGAALGEGQLLVGAAKTALDPDPEAMRAQGFPEARWETDAEKCTPLAPEYVQRLLADTQGEVDHLASAGSAWPENPDCLYMGGFGLGPMNPITSFDQTLGLWVRSVAFSDGVTTAVITVIDGEGWLWDYGSKCTDCGAKQLAARLAADPALAGKGLTPASFVLHATHAHSSMDFIGGWGFGPDWYMKQVSDRILATAKQAVLEMEPAVVEVGEVQARGQNRERRDTYRSAEEQQLSWLRAVAVEAAPPAAAAAAPAAQPTPTRDKKKDPTPSPSATPTPDEPAPPRVIATLGNYAAHPTSVGTNGGVAHPDWLGTFSKRLETRFGGIGLHVMSGLGNMSTSGGLGIGPRLADLLPPVGEGTPLTTTAVSVSQATWRQPLTNVPLTALGLPGLFDRRFDRMPAELRVGKGTGGDQQAPCASASAISVELPVSAIRIGDGLALTTGPGELFANVTNTIKERSPAAVTMPIAQANDALGYMPQSFELNPVGQQGLGFAAGGALFVNYEDSYAVDRCVGDKALETTLELLGVR